MRKMKIADWSNRCNTVLFWNENNDLVNSRKNSKGKLQGKGLKCDFEEEKTLIGAKPKWNKDF